MTCDDCGQRNGPNAQFCQVCGSSNLSPAQQQRGPQGRQQGGRPQNGGQRGGQQPPPVYQLPQAPQQPPTYSQTITFTGGHTGQHMGNGVYMVNDANGVHLGTFDVSTGQFTPAPTIQAPTPPAAPAHQPAANHQATTAHADEPNWIQGQVNEIEEVLEGQVKQLWGILTWMPGKKKSDGGH